MSEAIRDQSAPPAGVVEVKAFRGRAPVMVDLDKAAPFGWWAAIVIALVAFVDRVEVNLIAGALPQIQDHFGFSDTWAGAIPTAAAVAGAILVLPAGRLADRGPRVLTIAVVVLIWALCSVGSGLATSFMMFFVIRVMIGGAGQLYNPPASSLLADYYPRRQPLQGVRLRARGLLHGPARGSHPRRRHRRRLRLAHGLLHRRRPRRRRGRPRAHPQGPDPRHRRPTRAGSHRRP